MSTSTKTLLALCAVAFMAACAPQPQEEVVYVDEAVTVEPTYTGKYK